MSQVDPPKPPPLPPPSCPKESKPSPLALNTGELSRVYGNELNLAIQRVFPADSEFNNVFYLSNTSLMPQLQDGPKCGLVALSIATSLREKCIEVDDIFKTALSLGFTKQGEMFSADSLAVLAEECGFKAEVIKGGLNSHFQCIVRSLQRKCLLLVPYDADFNHAPCCKKGQKAHWTVITGFVIFERGNAETDEVAVANSGEFVDLCDCDSNTNSDLPLIVSARGGKITVRKRPSKETGEEHKEGKLYLIGLQGKSRHVGVWPFDEMSESNLNLVSFGGDAGCYVFPEGGLEEGLKGKAIILDYSRND